mmetsp:Transcript_109753/g.342097  ORF Transcript_109753/g.342097 Transcript_109753/m.342097 type:complete len:196 (+) Transcript_109753:328-915(+)
MAKRRLVQIRERLHDPVKRELGGPAYETCFGAAPFAHKGGMRGTTARLKAWCEALAGAINAGICTPGMVWLTLQFLEVPAPPSLAGSARASASSAAGRVRDRLASAAGAVKQRVESAQAQVAESASTKAVGFAARNPKAAKAASGAALGFAKQNPGATKAAGQFGVKAAFGVARSNPSAAMTMMKASAKGARAAF